VATRGALGLDPADAIVGGILAIWLGAGGSSVSERLSALFTVFGLAQGMAILMIKPLRAFGA